MVVDLPRCAAILSSRVPRHLPLVRLAVRLHHSQDLEIIVLPPTRCVAPAGRPAWAHRRRRELARRGCGRARATEPSRAACHPRHAAASAAALRRLTLHPNTATAGPTIDLSGASPTHAAPRSRVSDLGLPPHPWRTERARPSHRCVHQGPQDTRAHARGERVRPTLDPHPSTRAPGPHRDLEPTATREARRRLHRSLQHAPAPPLAQPATCAIPGEAQGCWWSTVSLAYRILVQLHF